RLCDAIAAIAEVFKLTDPALLYLEVSTLVSKYPDIREEHIVALREMRQTIIETLNQNKPSSSSVSQPVFRDITVPSITMTAMTSMAVPKLLK
ncbi:hypothetical protein M9458_004889, partial [Cirrhinus mrigala]